MPIGVPGDRLGTARGRDPFAQRLVVQIVRRLIEQLVGVTISRQVHAVPKQLGLTVVGKVIRQEQRTAGDRLEDAHVDVVLDAPIEHQPRRRIDLGHLLEVGSPHEHRSGTAAGADGPARHGAPGKGCRQMRCRDAFSTSNLQCTSGSQANGSHWAEAIPSASSRAAPSRWAAKTKSNALAFRRHHSKLR